MNGESALIVRVPTAEPHVAHIRARHDPTAALGVPAHITVLYPFVPPHAITADVLARTHRALAPSRAFPFLLMGMRRFPGLLWLAPEPAAPFVSMTNAIARAFPAHPPYGGRFPTIVPHLTVAHTSPPSDEAIEAELQALLRAHGPIAGHCGDVELIENTTGRWLFRHRFVLPT